MSSPIITAQQLRALHEERKQHDLRTAVKLITNEYVIPAAEAGQTSVLIKQDSYQSRYHLMKYPILNTPPLHELVELLKAKFPDIHLVVGSETTIRQDGIFEKKSHILMDWSSVASS